VLNTTIKSIPADEGAEISEFYEARSASRDADLWIASISKARRAMIVTGNIRHLSLVPGVTREDWIRR
jgi:predicted nucleic acid-binding protein